MPLHSSFPTSVSTGGGGASLRTAYSQTAPATDGSVALWVKGDAPTGGEYLSALVEYGEISVENTQQTNASSSYVLGGGVYNGAIYFAQRRSNSYIDIMKLDLSTFQVSTFLSGVINEASLLGKGFVRGNKFYLISNNVSNQFCTIDLDTSAVTGAASPVLSSGYQWMVGIDASATKMHAVAGRTSGSGESLYRDVYEYVVAAPEDLTTVLDTGTAINYFDFYDDGNVLYALAEPYWGYPNSVYALDIANQKVVTYNGDGSTKFLAVFKAGNDLYLIHQVGESTATNCSVSRLAYNGTSISTELVAENLFSNEYFTSEVDDPIERYTSGYAVDGNVLWLYAIPTTDNYTTSPIIKVTLNADQYETDSIIISTTMQQKNLATIVKDDGIEIKVFVNEVLRKNADGTTSSVEAYTLSSDGDWVRV